MGKDDICAILNQLSVEYNEYDHPPVFTVEEAQKYWKDIPGTHCKNLFLRDNKGKKHFLVILPHNKQVDLKKLGEITGAGRLSFASEQRLDKYLGLTPGSVSPFGLINDTENHVEVFIDEDLSKVSLLGFHPNRNDATLTLSFDGLMQFFEWTGNETHFVSL